LKYIAAVRSILFLLLLLGLSPMVEAAQNQALVTGVVLDSSNAPIVNATVSSGGASATTDAEGTFELALPAGSAPLQVSASGFTTKTLSRESLSRERRIVFNLLPAPLEDKVLVTASRGDERLATAGSMTVVTSAELLNSGAGSLDDALRNTPGFSLFRRSSSRVSNPTTQGVTMRGVSGSGASRTLVLADGVPLNDPFGSWVYWNRVPQAAVERVEIVRGATGDLYGADALGGVIQVLTFAPSHTRLRLNLEGGSHDTGRVSAFGNLQRRGWHAEAAGEWLRTDGVVTVGEEVRGPVDIRADSDYGTGFFGAGYNAGAWHANVRVNLYDESRGNGTPLQVNSTEWKQVSGEAGGTVGGGAWLARAAGGTQDYFQTFSAITTVDGVARGGERLTTEQTTPSDFANVSGQWTRAWGNVVGLVGAEARRTESTVQEFRYSFTGVQSGPFFAGGRETVGALFGRVRLSPVAPLTLVLGARGDFWRSTPDDSTLPAHSSDFFSPRVSAGWRVNEAVSLHGAGYRSHRTPTLTELHRGFRVGAIVTEPNPQLDPETLTGAEGGVLLAFGGGVSARVTAFTNQLENAVTNVTIIENALRQRQNTDTIRSSGVEVEVDLRPHPRLAIGGVAVATRARFAETPAQPEIEGNRVPQVPTFQLGGSATYTDPIGFTAAVQSRVFGAQFDDDRNELELDEYGVLDLSFSQRLVQGFSVFMSIENLFDKDYDVGRTPLRTIGWPRTYRFGVRMFMP
jgi:outer membrane receptor protein involved in Fe transport